MVCFDGTKEKEMKKFTICIQFKKKVNFYRPNSVTSNQKKLIKATKTSNIQLQASIEVRNFRN